MSDITWEDDRDEQYNLIAIFMLAFSLPIGLAGALWLLLKLMGVA
jgi:hypothetical protein